jgi:hypothetical protein
MTSNGKQESFTTTHEIVLIKRNKNTKIPEKINVLDTLSTSNSSINSLFQLSHSNYSDNDQKNLKEYSDRRNTE